MSKRLHIIKASAGSGKTYNLALNYIEQLLFKSDKNGKLELRAQQQYHRHILAITFTNKATNEMKSRIVKRLHELAEDPQNSEYYKYFTQNCTPAALAGLQEAARKALAEILFCYGTFNVSTIDSFFQSIIRSFAHELNHDGGYDLTLDGKYAIAVAVHNFLIKLGNDRQRAGNTDVENWFRLFLNERTDDSKSWLNVFNPNGDLTGFAKKINSEELRELMPAVRGYLTNADGTSNLKRITAFKQKMHSIAKVHRDEYADVVNKINLVLTSNGLSIDNLNGGLSLAKMLKSFNPGKEPTSSRIKLVTENNIEKQFNKKSSPSDAVIDELYNIIKQHIEHYRLAEYADAIAKGLAKVGLLAEIDRCLEEYRHETNSLLIADTNELITRVIKDCGDVPFIYEKIGMWINHYMIDEFQDTSRSQYGNFKPLLDTVSENYNLIIGDSKQAIYRFRNADPSLFRDNITRDFNVKPDTLQYNYRSQAGIVTFNNRLIEKFLEAYSGYDIVRRNFMPNNKRDDYWQRTPESLKEQSGMVRVMFTDYEGNELVDVDTAVAMIPDMLLEAHKRFEWKDIIILVNTNKEGGAIVKTILDYNKQARDNGDEEINVMSAEMLTIDNSVSVKRIISMLRFIDLTAYAPSEESAEDDNRDLKGEILHAMSRRFKDQLAYSALSKFVDLVSKSDDLDAETAGELLRGCFEECRANMGTTTKEKQQQYEELLQQLIPDDRNKPMTLTSIVSHIIDMFVYTEAREDLSSEVAFINAFQDLVLDFEATRNGSTVREFLKYWDAKHQSLTVPPSCDANAVNVMTVHKSKGLEAECVITLCTWLLSAEPSNADNYFWVTGKDWYEQGGKTLLGDDYDPEMVPPILSINKKAARTVTFHDHLVDFVNEFDQNLIIDNANKTYVAFTRPCKELHIMGVKKKTSNQVTEFLLNVIPKLEGMRQLTPDEISENFAGDPASTGWYQMGEPWKPVTTSDNNAKEQPKKGIEWEQMAMPPMCRHAINTNFNIPDDVNSVRSIGDRMHALLSRINRLEDGDRVVSQFARKGILSDDPNEMWNKSQAQDLLKAIGNHEPQRQWFANDNEVLNERSLLVLNDKGEYEQRRPDRIVRRPDGTTIVIDYKFGEPMDRYHTQVRRYINALKATGEQNVIGYIWYLAPNSIGEVVEVAGN